jgi:hypothetical protein
MVRRWLSLTFGSICVSLAVACAGESVACPPDAASTVARATLEAAATAGDVPEGVVVSTATPDLSSALALDDAIARLHAEPAVSLAIDAALSRNPRQLIGLVNFEEMPCNRRDVACPAPGDGSIAAVDVGDSVSFFVPEEELRRTLERVMRGGELEVRYGARSRVDTDRYVVVVEGEPREAGVLPVTDDDARLTGMVLYVRAGSEDPPIERVTFLQEGSSAIARAYGDAPPDETIILFATATAVGSACGDA